MKNSSAKPEPADRSSGRKRNQAANVRGNDQSQPTDPGGKRERQRLANLDVETSQGTEGRGPAHEKRQGKDVKKLADTVEDRLQTCGELYARSLFFRHDRSPAALLELSQPTLPPLARQRA